MMRDQKARMDVICNDTGCERTMEWPEPSPAPKPGSTKVQSSEAKRVAWKLGGQTRAADLGVSAKMETASRSESYRLRGRVSGSRAEGGHRRNVRLQVRLTPDGRIEVQRILEGDTVLADAPSARSSSGAASQ